MVIQKQEQFLLSLDQINKEAFPSIAKNTRQYSEFKKLYNQVLLQVNDFGDAENSSIYNNVAANFPKLNARPWGSFFDIKEIYQIAAWLVFVCVAWTVLFLLGKDYPHIIAAGFIVLITNTVLVQTKMLNKRKKIKLKKKLKKINTTSEELISFLQNKN